MAHSRGKLSSTSAAHVLPHTRGPPSNGPMRMASSPETSSRARTSSASRRTPATSARSRCRTGPPSTATSSRPESHATWEGRNGNRERMPADRSVTTHPMRASRTSSQKRGRAAAPGEPAGLAAAKGLPGAGDEARGRRVAFRRQDSQRAAGSEAPGATRKKSNPSRETTCKAGRPIWADTRAAAHAGVLASSTAGAKGRQAWAGAKAPSATRNPTRVENRQLKSSHSRNARQSSPAGASSPGRGAPRDRPTPNPTEGAGTRNRGDGIKSEERGGKTSMPHDAITDGRIAYPSLRRVCGFLPRFVTEKRIQSAGDDFTRDG